MVSKKGVAMVVAAALLLSIGGLCVKMIPWQPLSINSFRSFISVGILLVFARLTRRRLRLTGGVVLGGLAVCGATALYTVATKLTTAGNAVLLQFTAPIFVILCSWAVGWTWRPASVCSAGCFAFSWTAWEAGASWGM